MNKAGFSGKPQQVSGSEIEDIPEALRDNNYTQTRSRTKKLVFLIGGLVGLSALALSVGSWYFAFTPQKNAVSNPVISASPPASTQPVESNSSPKNLETLLGHFAYAEAPADELQSIVADGSIMMRATAAEKFQAMSAAARASDVVLVPISGFRSAQTQEQVFFDIKAARGQATTKRAAVSAPPGYSEHHTGYAVDIGDGAVPATNLNTTFENTRAFKWLSANAAYFSFEMSFPQDNPQGVSYEPWHWRFVGDRQSLETFYKAKNSRNYGEK